MEILTCSMKGVHGQRRSGGTVGIAARGEDIFTVPEA
jgi:hypothetical protein